MALCPSLRRAWGSALGWTTACALSGLCPVALPTAGTADDAQAVSPPGYFHDQERGWFWYELPPVEIQPHPAPEATPDSARDELAQLQQKTEELLARAVLTPTEEHLRNYMEWNAFMLARADHFSRSWQQLLWRSPTLDHRLLAPASDNAIQAIHRARVQRDDQMLTELAQTHGLWFLFRGDCPLCHRFAPVLHGFAERYGFSVLAISLDGGMLAEFPHAVRNRHLTDRLPVSTVPAVFLVEPRRKQIRPVAYGYLSATELARRLLSSIAPPPNPPVAFMGREPATAQWVRAEP